MLNRCSYSPSPNRVRAQPVEDAAIRRGEQLPGDRAEKRRRHERGGDQRADKAAQRHVGARDQPGQRQRRGGGAERHAEGDLDRGQIGGGEGRIGRQAGEVAERQPTRVVGDAVPDQPAERQHDQRAQEQPDRGQQHARRIEPPHAALLLCTGYRDRHAVPLADVATLPAKETKRNPRFGRGALR